MRTALEKFFLEHVSHHLECSISDKNFSPIGLTILEIQNVKKKEGGGTLKDFIDDLYIVFKRVQPSFFDFDHIDICSVTSLRSRCFSIPFRDDPMVITKYSCAYEHN